MNAHRLAAELQALGMNVQSVREGTPVLDGAIMVTPLLALYVPYFDNGESYFEGPFVVHNTHLGVVCYPPRPTAKALYWDYRDALGLKAG